MPLDSDNAEPKLSQEEFMQDEGKPLRSQRVSLPHSY